MRGRVVVKFCRGKELYPFSRIVGTENVKVCFECLICSLCLTISLGMISSGEANIVFEETSEFFGECRSKLRTTIRDESVV